MGSRVLSPVDVASADAAFWDAFCAEHWRNAPVHLRFRCRPLAVESRDFFDVVLRASEEYRHGIAGQFLRMYVGGDLRFCGLDALLPAPSDRGLPDYAERARAAVLGAEFTVMLYTCQRFSPKIWREGRTFLQPLLDRVGLPTGYVDIDAFCGQYSRTPFGIHKDYAANFSYVVSGTKSMLFWPNDAFRTRDPGHPGFLGRTDYEAFADTAIRIDARAGDMIYWPASYWHIAVTDHQSAVSDGAWPTTLNLALYDAQASDARVQSALTSLTSAAGRAHPPAAWVSPRADAPPPEVVCALGAVRDAAASPMLDERLHEEWFKYVSAGGFKVVPKPEPAAPLDALDAVTLSGGSRIVWHRTGDELRIAANGRVLRCAYADSIVALLQALASGAVVACDPPFEARAAESQPPVAVRHRLLQALYDFDALDVAPVVACDADEVAVAIAVGG